MPTQKAIATLQNLSAEVKADDSIKQVMVNCGLLSQLQSMIENRVCTAKAIATLMNLSIGSDERKRQIVDRGAVASLVPLMAHANIEVRCCLCIHVGAGGRTGPCQLSTPANPCHKHGQQSTRVPLPRWS